MVVGVVLGIVMVVVKWNCGSGVGDGDGSDERELW